MAIFKFVLIFLAYCQAWKRVTGGQGGQNGNGDNTTATLMFVGDINFGNVVEYFVKKGYTTYNNSFVKVAPYLRDVDIAIGNLESPILEEKYDSERFQAHKDPVLKANKASVSALKFAGFDVMTVANNHLNDYREKAVNFTYQSLKEVGIEAVGANYGPPNAAPQIPVIKEVKGIKIGFLGYCDKAVRCSPRHRRPFFAGPALYSRKAADRDVKQLKAKGVDIIAVYLHWGREYNLEPNEEEIETARHLTSLGVTMVIGSHPHVLQPHCYQGNALVAFSLGNFLFTQYRTEGNMKKGLSKVKLPGRSKKLTTFEMLTKAVANTTKYTYMLYVTINRFGVVDAQYLPIAIEFVSKSKTLQPRPRGKWTKVCSAQDKHCFRRGKCLGRQ